MPENPSETVTAPVSLFSPEVEAATAVAGSTGSTSSIHYD